MDQNFDSEQVDGAGLIRAERLRQVEAEGFSSAHDDSHTGGELLDAAMAYLVAAKRALRGEETPHGWVAEFWPWPAEEWHPTGDPLRDLIKGLSLGAAEADRQLRVRRANPEAAGHEAR